MLARYYKKKANKERLLKKARKRYKNFSEEEKDKRSQYACEWYRNLSEEQKESINMVMNYIEDEYDFFFSRTKEVQTG